MVRNPLVPNLAEPVMLDAALLEIQMHLLAGLDWLNNAFGKIERREKNARTFPAVFVGGGGNGEDYINLMPDSHLGNYSFFDIEDGEDVNKFSKRSGEMEAKFNLVFWFDYKKVYPIDYELKSIENVKRDILAVFGGTGMRNSTVRIEKFYQKKENVFRGFNMDGIKELNAKRPYGMLRMSGEIKYFESSRCDFKELVGRLGINYTEIEIDFIVK